ncbi:MAG: hypothetical protein J0M10_18955 [Chitinophagales bacterium]|nr:hypothetical protein [Chitinophagales bacterium]
MKDGDQFLVILIPDNSSNQNGNQLESVLKGSLQERTVAATEKVKTAENSQTNPARGFSFSILGAALQAAVISLSLETDNYYDRQTIYQ